MGILIIVGMVIIGVTITSRVNDISRNNPSSELLGKIQINAPEGSRILNVEAEDGFLFVSLSSPGGDIIMIVELSTGAMVGSIELVDAP